MDTGAFDFFLLMTNLSQLKDRTTIERLFLEGLRTLYPGYSFEWGKSGVPESGCIEVCTRKACYGNITFRTATQGDPRVLPLVHNAGQMLALILENLLQEESLQEQNRRLEVLAQDLARAADILESRVQERTSDLALANRSLSESRQALEALNAELEERVRARTREIEAARASLESFAYTVSHDLRAPLRAIDGYSRELLDILAQGDAKGGRWMVERIQAGSDRMTGLIEAILSLAKSDRIRPQMTETDMSGLVREVVQEIAVASKKTGARPGPGRVKMDPLPTIRTDPALARQVLANLVGNAVKFSRTRAEPLVEVRCEARSDGSWVVVADNGVGFEQAQADGLFLPFQRLHGEEIEGVGIGLATVRKIVDRLGGAIEASGAPGAGAVFKVRLCPPESTSSVEVRS